MSKDQSQELVESSLMGQVVALSLSNTPEYKIAEGLGISRHAVRKMRNSEEFKTALKELSDKAAAIALSQFKSKLEELAPLAFEALKENLKLKKLDAVRVFGEFVGIKDKQDTAPNEAAITVVFPGGQTPKDISVESREIDE